MSKLQTEMSGGDRSNPTPQEAVVSGIGDRENCDTRVNDGSRWEAGIRLSAEAHT
jgi:hypothetical protein